MPPSFHSCEKGRIKHPYDVSDGEATAEMAGRVFPRHPHP